MPRDADRLEEEQEGVERRSEHVATTHDLGDDQSARAFDPADVMPKDRRSLGELGVDAGHLFEQATEQTRLAMVVTDPHARDDPIVYANQSFEDMTGYERDEIIGRNCRFLQGPDTDPEAVARVREGLAAREVHVVELLNYRKDGTPFWNTLHVGPIFDRAGNLTHFYGSQWDVTQLVEARERHAFDHRVAEELRHRTGNLFGVIGAMLHDSADGAASVEELVASVGGRLRALSVAHEASIASSGERREAADLHALVEAIVRPYRTDTTARLEMAGPTIELPPVAVTPLGMTLHELATNAVKHGPLGARNGTVRIAWSREGERLRLEWAERTIPGSGEATPEWAGVSGGGTGSRLIEAVLEGIDGAIETERSAGHLRATLCVPLEAA